MKNYKLAVVARQIGAPSETFTMRHMAHLAPKETIVIVNKSHPSFDRASCDFPVFELSNYWNCLHKKVFRFISRKLRLWKPHHQLLPAKKILRDHGVQIILGEYLNITHPWIKIAQELDIPIFAHAHGYDVSKLLQDVEWRNKYRDYNNTQGIITINKISRARLIECGLMNDKIHIVPYGIKVPLAPLVRSKKRHVNCLAVGRMVQKKAPLKLLNSFWHATKNNPQLRLDYVGDGDLLPEFKQYIKKWNLEDKVTFHGVQSNQTVLKLMQESDIFVQHSITDPETGNEEGLPVAILEAMAHTLPVISTIHAGIPESVMNGETGFLVREGDITGMADAICKLSKDLDLRNTMGKKAWERAKDHFSWDIERAKLRELLFV